LRITISNKQTDRIELLDYIINYDNLSLLCALFGRFNHMLIQCSQELLNISPDQGPS